MSEIGCWMYRVEIWCGSTFFTPGEWRVHAHGDTPGNGEPTVENLKRFIAGVEEVLRKEPFARFKFGPVTRARVVYQESETVAAEWTLAGSGTSD